jgi:hypothetical protein
LDANDIQKPVDFDQFRTTVKTLGLYWLAVNQSPMTNHAPQPPELADCKGEAKADIAKAASEADGVIAPRSRGCRWSSCHRRFLLRARPACSIGREAQLENVMSPRSRFLRMGGPHVRPEK